jgi:hypothetical protein
VFFTLTCACTTHENIIVFSIVLHLPSYNDNTIVMHKKKRLRLDSTAQFSMFSLIVQYIPGSRGGTFTLLLIKVNK